MLVDGGRVGGRERRAEVQRLGDVDDPTQRAPVAETTPMAESMHRYAPKPLCFVHLLRSPLLQPVSWPFTGVGSGRPFRWLVLCPAVLALGSACRGVLVPNTLAVAGFR